MTDSIKPNKAPIILGVAGGSGSGKTYFAQKLIQKLGEHFCATVYQDNFYFDQSGRFDFDGGSVNFDHPDSIDFETLAKCLETLKSQSPAEIPIYDFVTHQRQSKTLTVEPRPLIVVDGIFVAQSDLISRLCDHVLFFQTTEDLRFQRRLHRDVKERGRTPEGVRNQFFTQVKPMHDLYVEPSKIKAHQIIYEDDQAEAIISQLIKLLFTGNT